MYLSHMTNGRPGPVVIDVPYNVQVSKMHPNRLKGFKPPIKNQKPHTISP